MKTITITLDLPPRELHPNARPHWARKHKATKKYRGYAGIMGRTVGTRFVKARLDLAYFAKDGRGLKADSDNLTSWFKAGRDGLADAGLVANDQDFEVGGVTVQVDKARPRVEVTLTEISEQEVPGE